MTRRPIEPRIHPSGAAAAPSAGPGAAAFREAMSHWASGVAVLAVSDGEEIDAITISAFASLSVDPPLVIAAIGTHTSILPMLREERRFTVSLLAEEQRAVAGAVAQRLPRVEEVFRALDDPAVTDALAILHCTLRDDHDGGDHRLIVGEVQRIALGRERPPLLYYRRGYRTLS